MFESRNFGLIGYYDGDDDIGDPISEDALDAGCAFDDEYDIF